MKQLIAILFAIFAFTATAQSLTEVPERLVLIGQLQQADAPDYDGIEFNRNENIFSLEKIRVYSSPSSIYDYSTIAVSIVYDYTVGITPYHFFNYKDNSISLTDDTQTASELIAKSDNKIRWMRISVPPTSEYFNFVVDFTDIEKPILTASLYKETITTGVNDIHMEDGEVQWYTTSGIKVETPSAGLYIRRQNGEAKLVHVK